MPTCTIDICNVWDAEHGAAYETMDTLYCCSRWCMNDALEALGVPEHESAGAVELPGGGAVSFGASHCAASSAGSDVYCFACGVLMAAHDEGRCEDRSCPPIVVNRADREAVESCGGCGMPTKARAAILNEVMV